MKSFLEGVINKNKYMCELGKIADYIPDLSTANKNHLGICIIDTSEEIVIAGDVEDVLDVYFKQCSIEVTAIDLAKIGLFLARGGVLENGYRVVSEHIATIAKTLMMTCGMYDGSDEFAIKVGIPSKSDVSGRILSVIPEKMGIGVFGPSLDLKEISIGGIAVLEEIAENFKFSIFN